MKKTILVIALSTLAFSNPMDNTQIEKEKTEQDRLCKVFTEKVKTYEANNRGDELADRTLASYKERRDTFCKK